MFIILKVNKSDSEIVVSEGSVERTAMNLNKINNFLINSRSSIPNNRGSEPRKLLTPEPKANIFHQTNYRLEDREIDNLYSARSMNVISPKQGGHNENHIFHSKVRNLFF